MSDSAPNNFGLTSFVLPSTGRAADTQRAFSEFLLEVGEGRLPTVPELGEDIVRLPDDLVAPTENVRDLIDWTFGPDASRFSEAGFFTSRAILAPRNVNVDEVNRLCLQRMDGEVLAASD